VASTWLGDHQGIPSVHQIQKWHIARKYWITYTNRFHRPVRSVSVRHQQPAGNHLRNIRQDSHRQHHQWFVSGVISNGTKTFYELKVLRTHGTCDIALHAIFRSVIIAKLLYVSSALYGFIKVADRQRVDTFLLRSKRCGYCPMEKQHLLYNLLSAQTVASQNYQLRKRQPNRQLPKHTGHLTDSNFITRTLYADIYWKYL